MGRIRNSSADSTEDAWYGGAGGGVRTGSKSSNAPVEATVRVPQIGCWHTEAEPDWQQLPERGF